MDCSQVRDLLDPYLDGELTKAQARELEDHLATCKRCAYESTQLLRMKEVIQRWQGVAPSGTIREELLKRVRREVAAHGTPRERYIRRSLLSAVALVLIIAGITAAAFYVRRIWPFTLPPHDATQNHTGDPGPIPYTGSAGFATVVSVSGNDVRVIARTGDIYQPVGGQELVPGETVEVGETSLLGVDIAGGRVLIGAIAWRGKTPPGGLRGPTRLRFASQGAGLSLARGTVRVIAAGGGVGDIRFQTNAGTIYVPWTGPGNESAEVSICSRDNSVVIGVSSGEAGVLVSHADGTTINIPVKRGQLVLVDQAGHRVIDEP